MRSRFYMSRLTSKIPVIASNYPDLTQRLATKVTLGDHVCQIKSSLILKILNKGFIRTPLLNHLEVFTI